MGRPREITLVGHSIGGLLARYAYLAARGGFGDAPREWASQVRRIVLLATPNRGLAISRLPVSMRWGAAILATLSRGFTLEDVVQGSAFLTNLRVQWLRQVAAMANHRWSCKCAEVAIVLCGRKTAEIWRACQRARRSR